MSNNSKWSFHARRTGLFRRRQAIWRVPTVPWWVRKVLSEVQTTREGLLYRLNVAIHRLNSSMIMFKPSSERCVLRPRKRGGKKQNWQFDRTKSHRTSANRMGNPIIFALKKAGTLWFCVSWSRHIALKNVICTLYHTWKTVSITQERPQFSTL